MAQTLSTAGQEVWADGCRLSRLVTSVTHSRDTSVTEATALADVTRRRVRIGLADAKVTLTGYYDPALNGLAQLPAFRGGETGRVTRLQHALGRTAGVEALTYDGLVLDAERSITADTDALVTQDAAFSSTGGGVSRAWRYGGRADFTGLHQSGVGTTTYLLGNPAAAHTLGADGARALHFDRQSLGGSPTRIEVFVHIARWTRSGSGTGAIDLTVQASTGGAFTAWSVNGFGVPGVGGVASIPASRAAPFTIALVSTGVNRRYLAPVITVPAGVGLSAAFALFYRILP